MQGTFLQSFTEKPYRLGNAHYFVLVYLSHKTHSSCKVTKCEDICESLAAFPLQL